MKNGLSSWSIRIIYVSTFNFIMVRIISSMYKKWNKGRNYNRNSKNYNRSTTNSMFLPINISSSSRKSCRDRKYQAISCIIRPKTNIKICLAKMS